jgi:peptide/nickel transport system permease protein
MGAPSRRQFGASTGVLPGADAFDIFLKRFPATIELSAFAIILAIILGIPMGYVAAKPPGRGRQRRNRDQLVGVAVPVFFLAFLLKYFFAIKLGAGCRCRADRTGINAPASPASSSSTASSRASGTAAWDAFKHLILPAVALASIPFAVIFRITRGERPGRPRRGLRAHRRGQGPDQPDHPRPARPAQRLLPVVTTIGLQVGALLAGAVLTERVFSFGGIGDTLAISFEHATTRCCRC